MKKSLIILGSLLVLSTFSVSGFSKDVERKLAQAGATEKPLGSVIAVEREFAVSFDACKKNIVREEKILDCKVYVFPKTEVTARLSSSLDGIDAKVMIKKNRWGNPIDATLIVLATGFEIHSWIGEEEISDEEFLNAAKKLTIKFPKASVKLIKITP